jgi:hypothetical protein
MVWQMSYIGFFFLIYNKNKDIGYVINKGSIAQW